MLGEIKLREKFQTPLRSTALLSTLSSRLHYTSVAREGDYLTNEPKFRENKQIGSAVREDASLPARLPCAILDP